MPYESAKMSQQIERILKVWGGDALETRKKAPFANLQTADEQEVGGAASRW